MNGDGAPLPLSDVDQIIGEVETGAQQALAMRVVGRVLEDRLQALEVEDPVRAGGARCG